MDLELRQTTYAPGLRQPRHSHDYSNVTVVVGGALEETTEAGRHRAESGSVVFKAAGCEHETRVDERLRPHGAPPPRPAPADLVAPQQCIQFSAGALRTIET